MWGSLGLALASLSGSKKFLGIRPARGPGVDFFLGPLARGACSTSVRPPTGGLVRQALGGRGQWVSERVYARHRGLIEGPPD